MNKKEDSFKFSNAIDMEKNHGERFKGWYFSKFMLEKKTLPLNYKDIELSYRFTVCDYNVRFIMPPEIEFIEGKISYTEAERLLGIFRFPRNDEGNFVAPFSVSVKNIETIMELPEDDLKKIFKNKNPLVFKAFKIPQYGFKFLDITENDLKEIKKLTDPGFIEFVSNEYIRIIDKKMEEIKQKILSKPNYLLILKNVLNRQWKNLDEVSIATDKIIET
ncbi:hypothetical protein DRQ07_08010 [candidate division KSB1 bacterium]|nr:MAG: hypothetical protein DRQ07_08010 [candidate division KSB1 bacterium]